MSYIEKNLTAQLRSTPNATVLFNTTEHIVTLLHMYMHKIIYWGVNREIESPKSKQDGK